MQIAAILFCAESYEYLIAYAVMQLTSVETSWRTPAKSESAKLPDERMTALAILVLACVIRLISIALWSDIDVGHADSSEYIALAQNIRVHGAFSFGSPHPWGADGRLNTPGPFVPTASRAPLYPLVIAGLWWGKEPPILGIRLLQVLLGGLTALLVYRMALPIFGRQCALLAGLAMALAPRSVHMTATVMSEILFSFLLTVALWLWGQPRGWLAGILLGAATLTRAVSLPFIVLLALITGVLKFNRTLHLRIVLGAMLVILPWTIRNAVTQHAFIPVAAQGWGSNLLVGTIDVPYGSGNPWPQYIADGEVREILQTTHSESEAEKQMVRVALQKILRNPLQWLWIRTKQYPRLFTDSPAYLYRYVPLPPPVIKFAFLFGELFFLVLSIAGMFMARAEWPRVYHLALFPVLLIIVQFPVLTDGRYSLPIVPMMAIFAAVAASGILPRAAKPEQARAGICLDVSNAQTATRAKIFSR